MTYGTDPSVHRLVMNRAPVGNVRMCVAKRKAVTRQDAVVGTAPSPPMRRLPPGHPGLLTVAASLDEGQFVVVRDRAGPRTLTHRTGAELAASLSDLPLYGRDLRLWLARPVDPGDQPWLHAYCGELAEMSGARVWAPPPGAWAELLDGCLDLGVRAPGGRTASWREYPPDGAEPGSFVSDADGRLMPVGGARVRQVGGVRVVAVPPGRDPVSAERFDSVWMRPGLSNVELATLDDGRLAVPYTDGSLLAVGGEELARLLRDAGWVDEDLCLLSAVTTTQAAAAEEHLRALATVLGVDIYHRTPDTNLSIQDGHPRAVWPDGRPATWHRTTPPGLAASQPRWSSDDGWLEPVTQVAARADDAAVTHPSAIEPFDPPGYEETGRDQPELVDAEPDARRSGLDWLPQPTPVNAAPLWLWVSSSAPAARAHTEGVPAAELFLLGRVDRDHEDPAWADHDVQLLVEPGAAVAAARVTAFAPERLRERLAVPGTYLIPAGWLDRARLPGPGETLDGRPRPGDGAAGDPVVLQCAGAAHGVAGVPEDVVTWPHRRHARVYAVHPARGATSEFVPVLRRRPTPAGGYRLLELDVPGDVAIDVPASAARMAELPLVRSCLPDFARDGFDLLLPRPFLDQVTVSRAFVAERGAWRAVAVPDLALDELLVG